MSLGVQMRSEFTWLSVVSITDSCIKDIGFLILQKRVGISCLSGLLFIYLLINSFQWNVFKFEIYKEEFCDVLCRRVFQSALSTFCCRDLLTIGVPFSLHCVKNMDSCRVHHDKIGDNEDRAA